MSAMGNRILKMSNIKKTVNYLKKNGVRHAYYAVRERIAEERACTYYYREPAEEILTAQRKETEEFPYLFSIVVPAYETKEEFLREMVDSVRRQSYRKWELILVDASEGASVERVTEDIIRRTGDVRIKYRRQANNKGISGNTNTGIALAAGDYIALLDHDDFLTPDALYHMAVALHRSIREKRRPFLIYSDEDKYDNNTRSYISPHRKKEFNLDLLLSNNYICHFMAVEGKLLKTLQLRGKYDGAQDYDLVLRIVSELAGTKPGAEWEKTIVHIPQVLYHWRCHTESTAENTASKSYAYEAGRMALVDFCSRQGWKAHVGHSLHLGFYDVIYEPDILSARADVGVVGGKIINRHNRICAGMYDEQGKVVFEGLPKEYSGGSTHGAVLMQDCAAVDIRCMQVRRELWQIYKEVTGVSYNEKTIKNLYDGRMVRVADLSGVSCDEAGFCKLSMEFCRAAYASGYRIVWNPRLLWKNISVSAFQNGGKI